MLKIILIYFTIVNLITIILTLYDKNAAKKHPKKRVSESVLILLALLGGGMSEYITMKDIRHKTLHKKFMVGLPLIICMHLVLIFLLLSRW